MNDLGRVWGGILLVSGTTIGAGMLALPVSTGLAGFFPAELLFLAYWFYMTYTAFLILEINLWMGPNANMITMARTTLGRPGQWISWVTYLFLLYSLTTAYLALGGSLVIDFIAMISNVTLPFWIGLFPLFAIFSFFVFKGTASVDRLNRVLMTCMALAYIVLVGFSTQYVQPALLARTDSHWLLLGVSIVAVSFGFHIIIPTLTTYLHRDEKGLKRVIFVGSLIPLGIYTIWELVTLGIIPLQGSPSLQEGYVKGINSATLLASVLHNPTIDIAARFFMFFAIVTSFLGVSLSLWDCLADGFHIRESKRGQAMLYVLTFVPPLAFALTHPRAFFTALEYAGAFGVVILLGLLPALMVWWGRYRKGFSETEHKISFRVPGGKPALVVVIVVSLVVIAIEIFNQTGLLKG